MKCKKCKQKDCKHEKVVYCEECKDVVCEDCGKKWEIRVDNPWYMPYPTYPYYPTEPYSPWYTGTSCKTTIEDCAKSIMYV